MYNTWQCWNFELGQVIMSDAVSSMCRICTTQRLFAFLQRYEAMKAAVAAIGSDELF